MQKIFLLILLTINTLIFPFFTGLKYTFRNTQFENYIVLTSSIERKVYIYDLETNKLKYLFNNVGVYPAISYTDKNYLFIIDTVGKEIILIDLKKQKKYTKRLEHRPIFYNRINSIIYILDSEGNLFGYDFNLNLVYYHKFVSTPNYFYFYKSKPIGLYIWKNDIDFEYQGKIYNYNLTTPSLLVDNFIIDTRGGNILEIDKKKLYKSEPYISFAIIWNKKLYFGSMFSNTIYSIESGKIEKVAKLNYQPTYAKIINDKLYILSASNNKLIIFDNNTIQEIETGDFPIEIFSYKGEIAVVCAENGEINIFEF